MTSLKNAQRGRVREVIATYGKCMELIPMDPNFHEITVGLYVKDGIGTVWTFSGKPGVEKRVAEIRDQLVVLGGMVPVEGTHNQAKFPDGRCTTARCGSSSGRPSKSRMAHAIRKRASRSRTSALPADHRDTGGD